MESLTLAEPSNREETARPAEQPAGTDPGRAQLAWETQLSLRAARDEPDRRDALHEEVMHRHLWLADSLARRYDHRGEDLDDLIQVARMGLVESVRRYDPDRGPFLAFATPTILGVLKRHFRDHGWLVRPPRRTQEIALQARQQWSELAQRLGQYPSQAQAARSLGESASAVREASCASRWYHASSLEDAMTAGLAFPSGTADRDLELCEARILVAQIWQQLSPEEQRLLWMRFYQDKSQSEIAQCLCTSQMQISRLLHRTLTRLQNLAEEPIAS